MSPTTVRWSPRAWVSLSPVTAHDVVSHLFLYFDYVLIFESLQSTLLGQTDLVLIMFRCVGLAVTMSGCGQ